MGRAVGLELRKMMGAVLSDGRTPRFPYAVLGEVVGVERDGHKLGALGRLPRIDDSRWGAPRGKARGRELTSRWFSNRPARDAGS